MTVKAEFCRASTWTTAAACLFLASILYAQTDTGKLEGIVRDKDTGRPLAGAQILVKGTRLGNVTTNDGYYFILSLPVGEVEVSASFTGYRTVTRTRVRIMAGHTATLNFELPPAVIEMEAISIEAEAEPLIIRDNTTTKQRQTREEIEAMPVASLDDVVAIQPGVVRDGERFSIRGGRVGEEALYVDGVLVKNFGSESTMPPILGKSSFTEVYPMQHGHNPDNSPLDVNTNAVEEITIITGGFQAEYGNAKSGVINIVTKEGTDYYSGKVRFRTDGVMPRTSDFGFNELSGSVGGPIPLVPFAFFHASAEAQGRADWSPKDTRTEHGFRRIDQEFVGRINSTIAGKHDRLASLEEFETNLSLLGFSNPARRPGAFGDRFSISEKITWAPTKSIKILQTLNRSRNQRLAYNHRYAFRIGNNELNKSLVTSYLVGADWNIQQSAKRSSILTVRAGYFKDFHVVGVPWERGILDRTYYGSDDYLQSVGQPWEYEVVNRPTLGGFAWEEMKTWVEKVTEDPAGFDPGRFVINADTTWMFYLDQDNDGKVDEPYDSDDLRSIVQGMPGFQNYFTRYYDTHRGPWGIWNGSFHHNHMQVWRFSYANDERYTVKADFDNQIDKYNRAKLGVDLQVFPMENFSGGWTHREASEVDNQPYILSSYIQDRLDLGDFVVDIGLRYDRLDPKGDEISYFRGGSAELLARHTRILNEFAPRLGVAFPVTDRTQVRLSFGHFYQPPSFRFLLRGDRVGREEAILDYTRTIMFEAGITALLSDELVVDCVGYNRDIQGDFAYRYIRLEDDPTRSIVALTNLDYGNVRGMTTNIQWRYRNYLNARLSYTLQFARSTGTDPATKSDYLKTLMDPITLSLTELPSFLDPLDYDETHNLNSQIYWSFPRDFQQGTLLGKVLGDVRLAALINISSGRPGDLSYNGINTVALVNAARASTYKNVDLRVSKNIRLGRRQGLRFFIDVTNLFYNWNFRSMYNPNMLKATDNQIQGLVLKGQLPIEVEAGDVENYWWQRQHDLNQDGWVDPDEWRIMQIVDRLSSYAPSGRARWVRAGVEFNF